MKAVLSINKDRSDTPVDEMMEEELELIKKTSLEEQKDPRDNRNTGTNTYKTSEKNMNKGVRDSFKHR